MPIQLESMIFAATMGLRVEIRDAQSFKVQTSIKTNEAVSMRLKWLIGKQGKYKIT